MLPQPDAARRGLQHRHRQGADRHRGGCADGQPQCGLSPALGRAGRADVHPAARRDVLHAVLLSQRRRASRHRLIKVLPLGDGRERLLFTKFSDVTRATVKGTFVVAIVQGSIGGIAFAMLGLGSPVLWGVMMARDVAAAGHRGGGCVGPGRDLSCALGRGRQGAHPDGHRRRDHRPRRQRAAPDPRRPRRGHAGLRHPASRRSAASPRSASRASSSGRSSRASFSPCGRSSAKSSARWTRRRGAGDGATGSRRRWRRTRFCYRGPGFGRCGGPHCPADTPAPTA